MSLPKIGASLSDVDKIVSKGRKTWRAAPDCPKCSEPCFPRGQDGVTGLCWFCRFPR